MKQSIRLFSCFILLLFCSCNKWLDVKLINNVEDAQQFSTEQGFKEALAGVYYKMSSPALYGQTLSFGTLEVMSRNYDYSMVMNGYKGFRDYRYTDTEVEGAMYSVWYSIYSNVAAINNILEWGDKNLPKMPAARLNQIKGEALALRAFHHFDIYRLFSANYKLDKTSKILPYQLKFDVKTPDIYTTEGFLKQVILDLTNAAELLKGDPILNVTPYQIATGTNKDFADQYVARMNYFAVKAMLARVYMDMGGEWTKEARKLAEEVIESKKFALVDVGKSINVPIASKDLLFSDEHIFSLRNVNIREGAKGLHKQLMTSDGNLQMSAAFKALIFENDNDDYRLNWFDQSYIIKYNIENNLMFFPKVPMIKLSEMYLIAAEGWMNDDPARASALLQKFRQSRTQKVVAVQTVTEEVILQEIRKDFICEGQLFYAYKRLNHEITGNSSEEKIPASKAVFVIPLPKQEIENRFN